MDRPSGGTPPENASAARPGAAAHQTTTQTEASTCDTAAPMSITELVARMTGRKPSEEARVAEAEVDRFFKAVSAIEPLHAPLEVVSIPLSKPRESQVNDNTLEGWLDDCCLSAAKAKDDWTCGQCSNSRRAAEARLRDHLIELNSDWHRCLDALPPRASAHLNGELVNYGPSYDPRSFKLSGPEECRWRCDCPACGGVFLYDHRKREFRARCLRGCSPVTIAAVMEPLVYAAEAKARQDVIDEQACMEADARAAAKAACSLRALRDAPPIRWFIPGVVPAAFVLKFGDKGSRKTFDAIHKALAIASGVPYHGIPVERGVAMLVLLEGGDGINARYLRALAGGLGVDVDALDGETLFVYPGQLDVEDDRSWAEFVATVGAISPDWIAVDNLTQVRGSSHENDNAASARIMKRLERLCKDRKIGIELLHHESKAGGSRGASSTEGGVDVMFRMKAGSAKNDALVTLERAGKDRTGAALEKLTFRYIDQPDGSIVPTLAEAPAAVKRSKRQREMLEAIGQGGVTNVRNVLPTWSSREVKSVRDQLEGEGLIAKVEGVWQVVAASEG
jgi:hypothetical protein